MSKKSASIHSSFPEGGATCDRRSASETTEAKSVFGFWGTVSVCKALGGECGSLEHPSHNAQKTANSHARQGDFKKNRALRIAGRCKNARNLGLAGFARASICVWRCRCKGAASFAVCRFGPCAGQPARLPVLADMIGLHNTHYRRLICLEVRRYSEGMRRDLARHAVLNPPAFRTRAAAHRRCAGAGKWWRCACWVVLLLCAGCGYSSSYVPPVDGRARVVWNSRDSEAVASLSGLELSQDCQQAIGQMTGQKRMPLDDINQGIVQFPEIATEHTVARPEMRTYGGYWVPRYYGPNIVVVQPGLPPVFPRPPLYVPFAARPHIGLSHSTVAVPSAVFVPRA